MKRILLLFLSILIITSCQNNNNDKNKNVKVMSFNIRYDNPGDAENSWDNRKDLVVNLIKEENPDILGLQEALKHQLDYIQSKLPDYFWVGVGRDDGKNAGEFSPIFYKKSRFKKLADDTFWLSESPDSVSFGWDAACRRVCTQLKLKDLITQQIIVSYNTHFDHQGKTAQQESAKLLVRKTFGRSDNFPFVITGDFNVTDTSKAYEIITKVIDNFKIEDTKYISKTPHEGISATYTGFNPDYDNTIKAIDHIFVRNYTEVLSHKTISKKVDGKFISDHFPVVAEIRFNKPVN